ncbi:MAG: T9SS type A sorting domain-containing protein [Bacteroidales bacterium]|nr:T9SS type A sorting domain-containing protein [Bacteroidales bacterium]
MRHICFILVLSFLAYNVSFSQIQILQENFGASTWSGDPADYPDYTSNAEFGGDVPHLFQTANSTGYDQASGGAAVLMGSWSGEENVTFVMECNTSDHTGIRLSFGIKHNSNGWGTCALTNNFTEIEYSTDSVSWSVIDKASLLEGSAWPCADDQVWAFVELAEELPSSENLVIRFTHTSPDIHPYYLDDITLTGYNADSEPPTPPAGLQGVSEVFNEVILTWNAASDNNGIKYYKILKDGVYLMSSADTVAEVKYQRPGSSADFTVVAIDVADNRSEPSNSLNWMFGDSPADYKYSWETSHASIMPGGDIEWKPLAFEYSEGSSVKYIDYENGDDTNDGLTKLTPWKHHPWDNNATSNAAACSGIHTYVFKRGVVYRGVLDAKDSGTPLEPVRLTSDPSWGTGQAYFLGSVRIESGWIQADAATASNMPEPEKVWYTDVSLPETKMVCELDGDTFRQLHVARSPNYQWTEDDLLRTWWKMTGKTEGDGGLWLTDNNNLVQNDPAHYSGATIFSQEDAIVMCTVWKQDVGEWDPDNNRIKVNDTNFGGVGSHYFIENTPFLLDTVNEFYYDQATQRLFVRLEEEKDPNTTTIEAATKTQLITIDNKHDIEISGIWFGVTTAHGVRYGQNDVKSTIRMTGICSNISIRNNEFHFVNGGISLNNTGSAAVNSHSITVSDNDFQHVGDHAIIFAAGATYIEDIHLLRNNIYDNGYRHQGRWYSSIPAIYGQLNYGEVAGNIINFSFGNGIDLFWGKGGSSAAHVPFIRGLIHQNKASNTLIGTNDYGGIESWQGGPAYCYNNYSHNAMGYKHYNNQSIGYAFYFDGSFKHIVFNNIASGVSHNRNSAAIMQVLGYYNMYAHNTAYNTSTFLNAWKDALALNGHNAYLSNVSADVGTFFRHEIDPAYIPFESYGYNVASGSPFVGSLENRNTDLSLEKFRTILRGYDSQLTQTGYNASGDVVANPQAKDFRILSNTEAIDRGVKFFTAFPLAKVVGEWNFYRHPADSSLIMGDNFYMTEDFNNRETYKDVPKNHLTAYGVTDSSFVKGDLEDWTDGALIFDGATVFCQAAHSTFTSVKSNNLDMADNDFILEAYFRTTEGHTGGVIFTKNNGSDGYELTINDSGNALMTILSSGSAYAQASETVVNDTLWHHLLVEITRNRGIDIYIDGQLSNGNTTGGLPDPEASLSNSSDFFVGKDGDNNFFSGMIDFLRVSRGSLYDAKTTVDELYRWQTDGPFLYDMRGNQPEGKRDAGALESFSSCELSLSETLLEFAADASSAKLTVTAADGFSIRDVEGDFLTFEMNQDTIMVSASENTMIESREGHFTVVGCNQTIAVTVTQEAAECKFIVQVDSIPVTYEAQVVEIEVETNDLLDVVFIPESFAVPVVTSDNDSVIITIEENSLQESRTAEITLEACNTSHEILIIQDAIPTYVGSMENNRILLYPNPLNEGHLYLEIPALTREATYTITDITGKILANGELFQQESVIEFNGSDGIYFIEVVAAGNRYREKFMVSL